MQAYVENVAVVAVVIVFIVGLFIICICERQKSF